MVGCESQRPSHPLDYPHLLETQVKLSGDMAETTFDVLNTASHSVTLTGADVSCFCVTVHGLPVVLEARSKKTLLVTVDSTGMLAGLQQQRFRFFTDRYTDTPYCVVETHVADQPINLCKEESCEV